MQIIIGEEERQKVLSVANRYNIDSEVLWEAYQKFVKINFSENLCDIAKIYEIWGEE